MTSKNKVFIIAEAGVNHNGSIDLAKKLVDVAVEAKADSVKFQTFIAENVISSSAKMAEYQLVNTGISESQLDMVKKLQLDFQDFIELQKYCNEKGILFLSTPFDLESLEFLKTMDLPIMKIPSGEITNLPYLRKIGELNTNVIASTGMSNIDDISSLISILESSGTSKEKITLLHCNTEYPTPMEDVNLLAMDTLRKTFGVKIGYSDHTLGIEVPIAAVALGAAVIEKHFTLDKNMDGPDHKASLNPVELKEMVTAIRNIENALGTTNKKVSQSEAKNIQIARKSIVESKKILKGEQFSEDNLTVKRPGNGISPLEWDNVIGQYSSRNFQKDELIEF